MTNQNQKYEVRNPQVESILKKIADRIKAFLPKGWGFTLFLFSYGEEGSTFYISTAQRESMIQLLEEFLAREKLKKES